MRSISTLLSFLALLFFSATQPLEANGIVLSTDPIPIYGSGSVDFAQYDFAGGTALAGEGSNGLDHLRFEIVNQWPVLPGSAAAGRSWIMTDFAQLWFNNEFYANFYYSIGGPDSLFILYDDFLQEVARFDAEAYFTFTSLRFVPDGGHAPIIQAEFTISPAPPVPEPGTGALVLIGVTIAAITYQRNRFRQV